MIKLTENDYPEHVLDEMMLVNNILHVIPCLRVVCYTCLNTQGGIFKHRS